LATKYAENPFDIIVDAYGVQEVFAHCPFYLAPGKPFVTVGIAFTSYSISSLLYASICMLQNMLWPRLFGGVDRPYVQVTALASLASLEKLAELAEEDCFDIVIDSSWEMEDILQVCFTFSFIFFLKDREGETLNYDRRTSEF
jgi:reticulon-4-interacting protein 1, mitochondrial